MYASPIYIFVLKVDVNGTEHTRTAHPLYGDDTSKDFEKESGEMFFRQKFVGKLRFIGDDYTFINSKPFDSKFSLDINISYNNGGTSSNTIKCYFTKADCEFDEDSQLIEVTPKSDDEYTKLLAGINKEFDLIQLLPVVKYVKITKRTTLQIYAKNDITCGYFIGNTYWESEVIDSSATSTDLINAHFGYISSPAQITIDMLLTDDYFGTLNPTINTIYRGNSNANPSGRAYYGNLYSENNDYYIHTSNMLWFTTYKYIVEVHKTSDDSVVCWAYIDTGEQDLANWEIEDSKTLKVYYGSVDLASPPPIYPDDAMTIETSFVYGRVLTADDTEHPIAQDDPIGNTGNLKYCVPNAGFPVLFSFDVQTSPTRYGTAASGEYWVKPQHNGNLLPVARNSWSFCSMWMVAYNTAQYDKKYILKDAYSLSSCINVLLQQIDTNVTHDCTPDYSSFLYGENELRVDDFTLLITPKSNILVNEYDKPASKATITLYQVLDMLKSTLQCYWFVEDGKLKIEHVKYFRNGGSYSSPTVETDLTTKFARNGKRLSLGTSKYSYNTDAIPERYEFAWMDEQTKMFDGLPIEVMSNYAEQGNIQTVNVARFASDVDMALISPDKFSDDGFFVLAAVGNDVDGYSLPLVDKTVDGIQYVLQNGYMAFATLQPNYWTWNIAAKRVKINGVEVIANGIAKTKTQDVSFAKLTDPDVTKTIKTDIGYGKVEKISVNLTSRTVNATLVYDPE